MVDRSQHSASLFPEMETRSAVGPIERLAMTFESDEARLFAFAYREGDVSLTDAKAVTGRNGPEARSVLESLVVQGLLQPREEGVLYGLAEHLVDRLYAPDARQIAGDQVASGDGDLVTDQMGGPAPDLVTDQVTRWLSERERQIIDACDVPRSLAGLMDRAGVTDRTFLRRKHLQPLLDVGIVRMTNPENPPAANQRYVLTEAGVEFKAARLGKERAGGDA